MFNFGHQLPGFIVSYPTTDWTTSIERKSRIPQIQGVKGEVVVRLLRTLDNEGYGVSSAFLKGKQNGFFYTFISYIHKGY